MAQVRPRGLDAERVERLLTEAEAQLSPAGRIDALSGLFLGRPFEANGLVGSKDEPEVFTASLDRFDCVTYVETVLALSRASRGSEFVDWLRRIRYDGGRVEWTRRNHYMTSWIRSNARIGVVRPILEKAHTTRKVRLLDLVPGLPPKRTRFACVPKKRLGALKGRLRTGDLVFFASTRLHLDVFHCGILVNGGERWKMRHAARSRKSVVETDLDEFLKANRTAGVIVVRPAAGTGPSA
jgi:hypothetical protein